MTVLGIEPKNLAFVEKPIDCAELMSQRWLISSAVNRILIKSQVLGFDPQDSYKDPLVKMSTGCEPKKFDVARAQSKSNRLDSPAQR